MARALANFNLLSALSNGATVLATRRGYSTAAAATAMGRERATVAELMTKRAAAGAATENEAACSWVPDPVTGYYRPANWTVEIDPAELREMLLRRNRSQA
ncbi:hypothetical protein Cni_G04826 [Canna indica]|uniref:Late embryogenesis abundant protein Lea5 n=1 Tax=Canna indica TaxID=4628 RepID=A0AAQ3JW15_9LILI|nr:hypothetical protein Cni_G04826 [Canna indica]